MKNIQDHLNQISSQKVLIRCNFDVPIEHNQVTDTTRIQDAISTIKLLKTHAKNLILLAHHNRPKGQYHSSKSLQPVVSILEDFLKTPLSFVSYIQDYHSLKLPQDSSITLIDNLRFWPQEVSHDSDFSQTLARWGDIFVNEAFASCHRDHASITGLPKHLPSFAGLNLAKEISILTRIRNQPNKPLVIVIGGTKLETKLPLIKSFVDKADHILVGGKNALDLKNRSHLPPNVKLADLTSDTKDITSESANQFAQIIHQAKTAIWNGTMGVFEDKHHQQGTTIIAKAINTTKAFTLVGGGDTESALSVLNLEASIDHISSGGGAMLKFLSQGTLIGLQALDQNH